MSLLLIDLLELPVGCMLFIVHLATNLVLL